MGKRITEFLIISLTFFAIPDGFAKKLPQNDETHVSIVVIDPGHGGRDFGANVGSAKEKDIVLDLSLRLGELIKAKYPDVKVIFTRKTDVFIPLYERAQIANRNKADLFISVHINGINNAYAQGTETFVLGQHRSSDNLEVAKKENSVILLEENYETTYEGFDPNSPESYIMFELVQDEYLSQSVMLASAIQMQFRNYANRVDRSVKQAGFLVLRQATMPSVLVEAGFITHKDERNYMLSIEGKETLSNAIFLAFQDYKRKIENKSHFEVSTNTPNKGTVSEVSDTPSAVNKPEIQEIQEPEIKVGTTENKAIEKANKNYYAIQIGASKKSVDTIPSNFKGLKGIYQLKIDDYFKYFSGKFESEKDAEFEREKIAKKFPDAFVVLFEGDKPKSVKKTP